MPATPPPAPSMSIAEAIARFESLEADLVATTAAVTASERTIGELRGLVIELQSKLDERGSFREREFRLVDPKTMTPDVFDDTTSWPVWSHKAKTYIGLMNPLLPAQLTLSEARDEQLTPSQIAAANLPSSQDDQLVRFLILRTSGAAHQIVKGAQAESQSALEIWPRLAARYDPKG